jgi:hypothetical protein
MGRGRRGGVLPETGGTAGDRRWQRGWLTRATTLLEEGGSRVVRLGHVGRAIDCMGQMPTGPAARRL